MKSLYERFINNVFSFKHKKIVSTVDSQFNEIQLYPTIFAGNSHLFEVDQHCTKIISNTESKLQGSWKKFCANDNFFVGLTVNNELYGCGLNTYGQLKADPVKYPKFETLTLILKDVQDVAIGEHHTLALVRNTTHNVVVGFGNNQQKQLSNTDQSHTYTPIVLAVAEHPFKPKIFAYGNNTGITYNYTSQILGENSFLQFSADNNKNIIQGLELCSVGFNTFFFKDKGENLYSCGDNSTYQLGVSTCSAISHEKVFENKIPNMFKISTIHSGMYCTTVVDSRNNIYVWGRCADSNTYSTPTQILEDDEWYTAVVGDNFLAAINTDGYTYCIGSVTKQQDLE